jgi:hypothetical protein
MTHGQNLDPYVHTFTFFKTVGTGDPLEACVAIKFKPDDGKFLVYSISRNVAFFRPIGLRVV